MAAKLRSVVASDGSVYHVSQFAHNCLFGSKRRQHCACANCSKWRQRKAGECRAKLRRHKERVAAKRAARTVAVVLDTAQIRLLQSVLVAAEEVAYEQGDTDRAVALDSLLAAIERAKGDE